MIAWVWLFVIILAVACLIDLPKARSSNQSLYGYFLLNGKLRLPGFVSTILSANLSIGNFIVFVASWGYLFGWGGIFWFSVNLCLNIVGYFIFLPAFRRYIEDDNNSGTIHEFLALTFAPDPNDRNRSRIRLVASGTTIFGLLFAIAFEIHLAAVLLASLTNTNPVTIFCLLTFLICIYSGVGGFHTLVFTDIVQAIAIFIGSVAILPIVGRLSSVPNLDAVFPRNIGSLNIGITNIVSICLVGTGWFLVAMDQWQRTCATRSTARTRNGMIIYLVFIVGFGVIYGLVGMFDRAVIKPSLSPALLTRHTDGANPLTDFFLISTIEPATSHILLALFAAALLAAAMSTANTFLIVSGHSFVSDLLLAVKKHTSLHGLSRRDEQRFLVVARATITAMGLFIIVGWLVFTIFDLLKDPLSFFFIAYSIQFALLAPMIVARFATKVSMSSDGAFWSIISGVVAALVCGFGFWFLMQAGDRSIVGLKASEWLPFTPVLTAAAGSIPFFFLRRGSDEHDSPERQ